MTKVAVFCDFDGTVARRDVGYTLFKHFSNGENEKLLPDWKAGRLSTRDCLLQEAAMVDIADDELEPFLDQFQLDPGFPAFVELCAQHHLSLTVLSDGLDLYIRYILARYGLDDLRLMANSGVLEDGKISVTFPFEDPSHESCGICKGDRIRDFRRDNGGDLTVVFVGDGYSDKCATEEADVLFAKKDLKRYCDEHGIEYYSFDTFDDVAQQMQKMGLLENHG